MALLHITYSLIILFLYTFYSSSADSHDVITRDDLKKLQALRDTFKDLYNTLEEKVHEQNQFEVL